MAIFTAIATAILGGLTIEATTFAVTAVATVLAVGPTLGVAYVERAAESESRA